MPEILIAHVQIIKYRQPRPSPKVSKQRARHVGIAGRVPDVIPEEDRLVSFVDVLWGGRFTSVLICESCKHVQSSFVSPFTVYLNILSQVSHTYEDFDDLSLSIIHDESKERKVCLFVI